MPRSEYGRGVVVVAFLASIVAAACSSSPPIGTGVGGSGGSDAGVEALAPGIGGSGGSDAGVDALASDAQESRCPSYDSAQGAAGTSAVSGPASAPPGGPNAVQPGECPADATAIHSLLCSATQHDYNHTGRGTCFYGACGWAICDRGIWSFTGPAEPDAGVGTCALGTGIGACPTPGSPCVVNTFCDGDAGVRCQCVFELECGDVAASEPPHWRCPAP